METIDISQHSVTDEIYNLNENLKDLHLSHLVCNETDAQEAIKKLHAIWQHLESVRAFARPKRLALSLVMLEEAVGFAKAAIKGIYEALEDEEYKAMLEDEEGRREAYLESKFEQMREGA